MKLSPIQEEIINTRGNLVVMASAGTGKTHTMVNKIEKEIKENKNYKVIAAITFTIKAAEEIKDRLSIDTYEHFIGTNNSFAINEIIKPFMKDIYGRKYDIDMDTDYSIKIKDFAEGIYRIENFATLCSYSDNKENFIFDLANEIVRKSRACQLYLKSKYFKIYIDEYQDCDKSMHNFFMYLCDNLKIETFIVGDEKQSIYMWRGAYPEAFKSIKNKGNFKSIFMGDNFRSCKQIQNYSNLLCDETSHLYTPIEKLDNVLLINTCEENWCSDVMEYLDKSSTCALLRFSNTNAQKGAELLTDCGMDVVYIPQIPIADITTESSWIYNTLAKMFILDKYSIYDLISEIPSEESLSKSKLSEIRKIINNIKKSIDDAEKFKQSIKNFAQYFGYTTKDNHIEKLWNTIKDEKFHVAFDVEKYSNIAITFHSSKGLEFEQVIVFAEDYRLQDESSIYNHYVATTRAKNKLIIIKFNNYNSNVFQTTLTQIFKKKKLNLTDVITVV